MSDLYASAPDDLWVAGGVVTRFDGSWLAYALPPGVSAQSIWGFGPNDVWVVGSGKIAHWDGFEWKEVVIPPGLLPPMSYPVTVHGTRPDDVWFGATEHVVIRFNGTWTSWRAGTPFSRPFTSLVWSSSPTDVWAGTLHLTSAGWVLHPLPYLGFGPSDIWGSSPNDVWATESYDLFHWNGAAWTTARTMTSMSKVSGSGPDDVWFVGSTLEHFDGTQFTSAGSVSDATALVVPERGRPIFGTTAGDVVRVEPDGGRIALVSAPPSVVLDAWWTATEGYAVGATYLLRYDGKRWQPMTAPVTAGRFSAVAAVSSTQVYVGAQVVPSNGELHRFDGVTWTTEALSSPVTAIWAGATNDVWVFCSTEFRHWDGTSWTSIPHSGRPVFEVAAIGAARWAMTDLSVLEWNGSSWTAMTIPNASNLKSLSVYSPTDMWVSNSGTVFHFDGVSWGFAPGASGSIAGVFAVGPQRVWIANSQQIFEVDLVTQMSREIVTALPPVYIERLETSNGQFRLITQGSIIRPP